MPPPAPADGKKLIRRLASSFAECTEQSAAYGACIKRHYEAVEQGACEKEFQALRRCFDGAIRKARAKGL